jgi:hypothetical protein
MEEGLVERILIESMRRDQEKMMRKMMMMMMIRKMMMIREDEMSFGVERKIEGIVEMRRGKEKKKKEDEKMRWNEGQEKDRG